MKKINVFVIMGLIALTSVSAKAQKITEGDKDLSFLKGQTKFNIEYDYSGMVIGKDAKPEADYLKEKADKVNTKQPGKGDRWVEKWKNDRTAMYEPMCEDLLNKMLFKGKTNATAAKKVTDAKYTIRIKTVVTEPGFNSMVMKVNPYCKFEISWVETATGKVMAKGELTAMGVNMGGSDWDFDQDNSIKECYAKCGKEIGATMAKKMK